MLCCGVLKLRKKTIISVIQVVSVTDSTDFTVKVLLPKSNCSRLATLLQKVFYLRQKAVFQHSKEALIGILAFEFLKKS